MIFACAIMDFIFAEGHNRLDSGILLGPSTQFTTRDENELGPGRVLSVADQNSNREPMPAPQPDSGADYKIPVFTPVSLKQEN